MGRNAQRVDIILANGKSKHLTKAEIERRNEAEVKLGKSDLGRIKAPDYIKNDIIAFKQWEKLIKDYKEAAGNGHEILTTTDVDALAKYCVTYSEYLSLIDRRRRVDEIDYVSFRDDSKKIKGTKRDSMNETLRLDAVLKLESAINKKHDLLIKLEDRLFLNPLAKIKNVPKREEKKKKNAMEDEYDL
jgi:phage terminase small subunit